MIGVCTSTIHLSGALAIPTWVLLGHQPDWRWLTQGDETPWYPGMRLFFAEQNEAWEERVERVNIALQELGNDPEP